MYIELLKACTSPGSGSGSGYPKFDSRSNTRSIPSVYCIYIYYVYRVYTINISIYTCMCVQYTYTQTCKLVTTNRDILNFLLIETNLDSPFWASYSYCNYTYLFRMLCCILKKFLTYDVQNCTHNSCLYSFSTHYVSS